ncbi:NAD(P)-dependent dehydrogenase (short-subunit alcohol dehydrogenase family) [Litorivivens lipolytica]|uniref:NAD(P)-dependent dehydrogenase (Short-subunit alcohol dehydrogenase family) n=1 Tax=Litorivivens lipolytica TaxID=1524264 RepID=A0A7W4W4B3_9GAMM|nr:SDR family oxidoreductase [Litorivivens lipolytica]MBB3047213.1 NAD(P)-dependent dehydrogenase (short-subunit alcohol dehydrogenase family) [Litorivivens lipolytica]
MSDILGYAGQNVVITGAASGMGAAATELLLEAGATVFALDIGEIKAPVAEALRVNIMEKASIDAALAELPDEIFGLFNCAGVPHPPTPVYQTIMINFVGLRYLTESLLPRIKPGGGVISIASTAGMAWKSNLEVVQSFLELEDFDAAAEWLKAENSLGKADAYGFSKQCLIVYTLQRAGELAKQHKRINCISPSPTQSAFMDNLESAGIGRDVSGLFCPSNGEFASGADMGRALVAINSKLGGFISGCNIPVDYGYCAEVVLGQRDDLLGIAG